MVDEELRNRCKGDDLTGKVFIMVHANGDLPDNPMRLGECLVCGVFFSFEEMHQDVQCLPSAGQPLSIIASR
jgi:hypothetical protein